MGLLKKACRRVWKRLSSGKRACKPESYSTAVAASPEPLETVHLFVSATSTSALPGLRLEPLEASRSSLDAAPGSCCRPSFPAAPVVNVTASNNPRGGVVVQQTEDGDMLSAKAVGESTWNVSSESDSGVCVGGFNGDGTQEDDRCSVWSGAEEEEEEEDFECECEECSFARCETILEDWHISAKDLSLEKVLSSRQDERVYSGYWHGSVTVHQRQSPCITDLNVYIREAHTLSKIRHENVQLFLGVCLDLNPDSVALVMSNIKGESLDSILHKTGQELQFSAMTKYLNQIAQGMAYLHDRGITHPLLTSKSIHIHYRACISMFSPAPCSNSTLEPSQLVYLPPEVIRTLQPSPSPSSSSPSNHRTNFLTTYTTNLDTCEANIFSFGTIVYEMVTMTRPFRATPGELIVWEVGNGRCQSLQHMNTGKLRDIVRSCWTPEPDYRPSFKELLSTLEHNMSPRACGLNAYFSFSDPGRLASH